MTYIKELAMKKSILFMTLILGCIICTQLVASVPDCQSVTVGNQFWYECDGERVTQIGYSSVGDQITAFKLKGEQTPGFIAYWQFYDGSSQTSIYYKSYGGHQIHRILSLIHI